MSESFDVKKSMNILKNAVAPYNPMNFQLALGSVEYVAVEVLISKVIRMLLGVNTKSIAELTMIHLISIAYLGGAAGFMEPPRNQSTATLMEQLEDGAKGIPAVALAMYVVDTAKGGFHVPFRKFTIADVLVSAAGKALSRPIIGSMYKFIPEAMQTPLEETNKLVVRQTIRSNLRSSN